MKRYQIFIGTISVVLLIILSIIKGNSVNEALADIQMIDNQGNTHIKTIDSDHEAYNSNPPTSGAHIGNIAPWGISKESIPDEIQIHNLEDGGVMIQYDPDKLPKEQWSVLEELVTSIGKKHTIVAPRYDINSPIALTAWNSLLYLDTIDEEKITTFINTYEGRDHHKRF